jgi:hypothetical protein
LFTVTTAGFDHRIEELASAPDFGRGRLSLRHLVEMLSRDDKTDEAEGEEQAKAQAGALNQDRVQEWGRRHVDGERPHQIVDLPMRFGLELVVAVDATLFTRERRIDGAEHRLTVGGQKFGFRFRIGLCGERFDRLGHVGIGRRRFNLSTGPANPTQPEDVVRVALLVKYIDRMSAVGRRDRRARAKLRADR